MDIKFEVNDYKFNVRSSCIIKDKEHHKVILTNKFKSSASAIQDR